jgi:hypothetical protein
VPAVACRGQGVLETFLAAAHAMLERLVAMAEPQTRRTLDLGDLGAHLDASFAPHLARLGAAGVASAAARGASTSIVLGESDLLESAVASSVTLGARLVDEQERAARLEREAESLRLLSDVLRSQARRLRRSARPERRSARSTRAETCGWRARRGATSRGWPGTGRLRPSWRGCSPAPRARSSTT